MGEQLNSTQSCFGPPHFHVSELFEERRISQRLLLLCNRMQLSGPVFYILAT